MLTPKRKGADYHHGDLKSAAIIAARNLVLLGGPQALGIRPVAQKLGVTAPALYRHFSSLEELLSEVSCSVLEELGNLMLDRRSEVRISKDKKRYEIDKFRAIGEAYVDYAEEFPLLFETAFNNPAGHKIGEHNDLAWRILNESIENFVSLGLTPRAKRTTAPLLAWSAVHGLATLVANQSVSLTDLPIFRKAVFDGVLDSLVEKRGTKL
jgi:AcrR family transcriptional regulator